MSVLRNVGLGAVAALTAAGLVPAASATEPDPAPAQAPVQILRLTDDGGTSTGTARAGLGADGAADASPQQEAPAPSPSAEGTPLRAPAGVNGGAAVVPGAAQRLSSVSGTAADESGRTDPQQDAALLTKPLEVGPFLVAGFTWKGADQLPEGTDIYLRVREDGVWSEWYLTETSGSGRDEASGTAGTDEFVTGGADAIQASVVGDASALPADLSLALVPEDPAGEKVLDVTDTREVEAGPTGVVSEPADEDRAEDGAGAGDEATGAAEGDATAQRESGASPSSPDGGAGRAPAGTSGGASLGGPSVDAALAALTTANGLPVPVNTRDDWGANPGYMSWDPDYAAARHVIVHHTAGTNDYSPAQAPSIVRGIYYYHAVTLDWGDIGYNFLVDKYGAVYEGRYGTLAAAPGEMVIGGHAYGANTGTMGISMMGTYTSVSPSSAQLSSVGKISGWFLDRAGVTDASGSSSFTFRSTQKYSAGQMIDLRTISAHRDVGYTTCPGDVGYTKLGEIRSIAQEQITGSSGPVVTGAIRDAWNAAGGAWGSARTEEVGTAAGGVYQIFEGGTAYWKDGVGAHFVKGAIFNAYRDSGYEWGSLGYPTSDESPIDGGASQSFENGRLTWSAATGAVTRSAADRHR